jgi:hypothetical protein
MSRADRKPRPRQTTAYGMGRNPSLNRLNTISGEVRHGATAKIPAVPGEAEEDCPERARAIAEILERRKAGCRVQFCRAGCKPLPDFAAVIRASGETRCPTCNVEYRFHESFYYPSGMGHAYKSCSGEFLHL